MPEESGSSPDPPFTLLATRHGPGWSGRKGGVARPRPSREGIRIVADDAEVEGNRVVAGDAAAERHRAGMATRYGANGRSPIRFRFPTNCEVQFGQFSTRPGAVVRSASGTNAVATT